MASALIPRDYPITIGSDVRCPPNRSRSIIAIVSLLPGNASSQRDDLKKRLFVSKSLPRENRENVSPSLLLHFAFHFIFKKKATITRGLRVSIAIAWRFPFDENEVIQQAEFRMTLFGFLPHIKSTLGMGTKNKGPSVTSRVPRVIRDGRKSRLHYHHARHKRRTTSGTSCLFVFLRRSLLTSVSLIGSSNRSFEVNGRIFSLLSIADLVHSELVKGHSTY